MSTHLQNIISKNKSGNPSWITSICSANKFVIEAAMLNAKKNEKYVLIESTSNQVNQYGGYTGLKPKDFIDYVFGTAKALNFPKEKIILGGDHLGPNAWKNENSESAMNKAALMIEDYVKAGYTKIHLDASMKCADDGNPNSPLKTKIVAERAAQLCKKAECAFEETKNLKSKPVYIIGSDVPPPGGETDSHKSIKITEADEVDQTIELTKNAFYENGLKEAWERVIAVVVQPGVDFGNSDIHEYDSSKTTKLIKKIRQKENLAYEAHSTDYQKKDSLKKMVEDNFAILKVGPWLTFAFREAVFALAKIEEELMKASKTDKPSNIDCVMEEQMKLNPNYWKNYYTGDENKKSFEMKYSFSDRIRYYWNNDEVNNSLSHLIHNLSKHKIPLTLLSQFLPKQYYAVRENEINNNPNEIIYHKINEVLEIYNYATSGRN